MSEIDVDVLFLKTLYRHTFWDWVRSLFRDRGPLESCRIYHSWNQVHQCPHWTYLECVDCSDRIVKRTPRCVCGQAERKNDEWLAFSEIKFVPKYTGGTIVWY